ncbi:DUF2752 domain-containing protein [Flavobacterium sp.]|jgi:hypothetical protein|uniref:DUF2752 domain-containing protein n=1 Tax=Flavobacterium sp. TaxID=239 RepID=UPI002A803D3A|nr:DUF2752 domain-containing protein [Flavobacterium sp.]
MLIIPFLIYYNNAGGLETEQSFCPFKMITGFPCPGCGITKSMVFFYEGNIYKSLYYHLFGPFVVLLCIFLLIKFTVEFINDKEFLSISYQNRKKITYVIAAILMLYHFIRVIYFISTNGYSDVLKESIWM